MCKTPVGANNDKRYGMYDMLLKVCDAMSAEENWDELRFHGVGWGDVGGRGGGGVAQAKGRLCR